jgi:hypothetical protein
MEEASFDFYLKMLLASAAPASITDKIGDYLSPVDRESLRGAIQSLDALRAETTDLTGAQKRAWKSAQGVRIGKAFEALLKSLFEGSQVFSVSANVHSVTGEIDLKITLLPGLVYLVPFLVGHTHILGEAKCHDKSMKSDWVTEMMGNMELHSTRLGFIFVYCASKQVPAPGRLASPWQQSSSTSSCPSGGSSSASSAKVGVSSPF